MSGPTQTVEVVFDVVCWEEAVEGAIPPRSITRSATRGEQVEVPEAEAKRLAAIAAVAAPEEAEEAQALRDSEDEPYPAGEAGDGALMAASAEDLIAYVGQFPDEQERVLGLEQARKKPRSTVVTAAGGKVE